MASFWVPVALRPGLELLRDLDDDNAARAIDRLRALPTFLSLSELVAEVGAAVPDEHRAEASEVIDSLLALVTQMDYREWTAKTIAQATAEAPGLDPEDDSLRARFAERIATLLDTPSIRSSARAADLLIHHERSFRSARVFTDVRPIFGRDISERPDGAVVVHMLEMNYWSDGENRSIYLALDVGDLERLRAVLDRALTKERTLDGVLESAGLKQFSPEPRES